MKPGSLLRDPRRFEISSAAMSEICYAVRSFMQSKKKMVYTLGRGIIARSETKDK